MTTKKLTENMQKNLITQVEGALIALHTRFMMHIDFDITEAQLFEAVVHPDDYAIVRRSGELFGYTRKSYYGSTGMRVAFVSKPSFVLDIAYKARLSWLPPVYALGAKNIGDMLPSFEPTFAPYIEQAVPIMVEYRKAVFAWDSLRRLCADDLPRMCFLWPVLRTLISHSINTDFNPDTQLSKPRSAPAVSPELRAHLNDATTFINTALLLPHAAPPRNMDQRVGLTLAK